MAREPIMARAKRGSILMTFLLVTFWHSSEAHEAEGHKGQASIGEQKIHQEGTSPRLIDEILVNRLGRKVLFKSEVIGDRIVALIFVYTSCTTVCPVVSALFAQVQEILGTSLERDVRLVSISIDPTRDKPARLARYANKFGAGSGWTWLTGEKRAIDKVLRGLEAYTPNFVDHPPTILIGDARRQKWFRFFGFVSPDDIVNLIRTLQANRTQSQLGNDAGS